MVSCSIRNYRHQPRGCARGDWRNITELVLAALPIWKTGLTRPLLPSPDRRRHSDAVEDGIVLLAEAVVALVGCVFLTRRTNVVSR